MRAWIVFLALAVVVGAPASLLFASDENAQIELSDCAAMFDMVALVNTGACERQLKVSVRDEPVQSAIALLLEHRFLTENSFNEVQIKFCPLVYGLGMVPKRDLIYIDDGLRSASTDTLAEIIFHELQHVKQMREMGEKQFKCAYFNALLECGGCSDRNHALEAPAYEAQTQVREYLLALWHENHHGIVEDDTSDNR